ncbi:MAG: tetratricopeptide repeat protein [Desulfobacteraceae bacterium]|uniref:Tetratricopeptide repeat protein n=1 Tax=Candidatus Desulfaltia bathyphila TaxID=2841697 RepID=A0A8J6N4P9_9BACT|nr:tetratricopeptide repeat protein [Candidatus Desulfaltia bathyphila]
MQKTPFFTLRREGVVCLFLALTVLAVYWQVGNHEFVNYDDRDYITENQHVQAGLTLKSIAWAFTSTHASNWHPLTWLSHMLDCQVYGLNSGGHHFTSVFFHILNSILLFLVFKRMTGAFWESAFVAALFAVHPLHVESVAWVAERKDVLSTFFWMLTMGAYILYIQNPGIKKYLLTVLLFALGLMAKPMLITLPFVLLLLDYWPLGRLNKRSHAFPLLWEKIPLFVLAAASSIVTFFVQQSGGAVRSLDALPLFVRISNALVSYISYIVKMILPHNMAILYPHPKDFSIWQVAGACLLLVFISFMAVKTFKRRPYFLVGWLWYLGTLVPVIGLVQVGSQSMADRYTYVPLTGIFIIIAWGISDLAARWRYKKEGLAAATAVFLSVLMVITWFQVRHWTNSITLFKHAINVTANNSVAHNNLGVAFADQGKIAEAIKHYTETLRIRPSYANAHNNIGNALADQGKISEAIKHYIEALRIRPDFAKAHNNIGNALADQGKISEAIKHYIEALRIRPDFAKAHNNIGNALADQGKISEAIKHYVEALRIRPNYAKARNNMGNALADQGRVSEAIKYYTEALRIRPNDAKTHNNLGSTLADQGKTSEAVKHYTEALRINPDFVEARSNLEKVSAILNEIDEAVKRVQKLLKVNAEDPRLHYDLGTLYYKKGEFDKAVYQYQKSLSIQPDNPSTYYNIACMYSIQNRVEKSIDFLKRAIEKGYDNWDHIRNDRDLENVRGSSGYRELVDGQGMME